MVEYRFDVTVNYATDEKDISGEGWYPSLETCLVALKMVIERETEATSFAVGIVQRKH